MDGRRVLQVGVAALVVAAVAVLARPADPSVPPPFEVERSSPEPREAEPTAQAVATPTPEAPARATPRFEVEPRTTRVRVNRFDPLTLDPIAAPVEVTLEGRGAVMDAISPDGRLFAIVHHATGATGDADLFLYDASTPGFAVRGVVTVPSGMYRMWFSADGGHLLWADFARDTMRLGGVWLDGDRRVVGRMPGIELPADFIVSDLAPLDGGRVGVHGYTSGSRSQGPGIGSRGADMGPVRLLVADVAAHLVTLDVTLPTSAGGIPVDGALDLRHLRAGVAWDVERHLVYVAHADRDAVLVVDLGSGDVVAELVAMDAPPGGGGGLVDDPEASRWRQAVLSGDGRYLVVHGTASPAIRAGDAPLESHDDRDLPLLVADLEEQTLRHADTRGWVLAVGHDGGAMAVAADDEGTGHERALRILDSDLVPRWEIDLATSVDVWFPPGGEQVHVFWAGGETGTDTPARLEALDLADGSVIRSVELEGGWWTPHLAHGVVTEVHER